MTTDLQALIQHLRGGDWNLRAPQEMADMIADKLEASLAAAPHPSPSAAGRLAPVGWQERQATRGGWSAWYDVDKVPSVAFMAARDDYQWRRVFASTSPAIAHVIALDSPDDLITVANVTLEDSGPTLTLHFDQLGDMGSILGEEEATYTVRIAPMRRGDFEEMGEFDGF